MKRQLGFTSILTVVVVFFASCGKEQPSEPRATTAAEVTTSDAQSKQPTPATGREEAEKNFTEDLGDGINLVDGLCRRGTIGVGIRRQNVLI